MPFRLTPNVVDAFGVTGCDGTFRVICEMTLQMIKSNKESICSVLETLVYDPLVCFVVASYFPLSWLTPETEWRENKRIKKYEHLDAMFSLKELKDRISGKMRDLSSNKTVSELSVEGHVSKLIDEATKVDNLAAMYTGWQSYW